MGRRTVRGEPYAPIRDETKTHNSRTNDPPRQFLVARLLGNDFYLRQVEKAVTAETLRRIVVTAIALKRFERRHGKLPAELSALVPEFLKAAPLDPMDGRPLRYRTTGEKTFLLYSVGLDGKDDGGDPKPLDRGAKNFSWTTCADWVWPTPATAEELRDYHAKLEQERGKKK